MITTDVRETILGGRKMTEDELQSFYGRICYGTVSYINDEGWPEMRPINIGVYNNCFYFHARKAESEKLKYWREGKKVVISMYIASDKIGIEHIASHESVLVYGYIDRIDETPELEEEAFQAMTAVCIAAGTPYKAAPERLRKGMKSIGIFRVRPEHIVGKIVKFGSTPG